MGYHTDFFSNYPMKGEIPKWFSSEFEYIVEKSNQYLINRSGSEIDFALSSLNYILQLPDSENTDVAVESESVELVELVDEIRTSEYFSPTKQLTDILELFDVSGQSEFPNANYGEYFAVLALALVGQAISISRSDTSSTHTITEIGSLALNAMEAICKAEQYLNPIDFSENSEKIARELITLEKRKGGVLKNAEVNRLKTECAQFYLSGTFKSKAEAARLFYDQLPADRKILAPTNAHRTLTNHLYKLDK